MKVLYCTGYKDTGEKGEDGNRILEPEYAPATIYEVDEERTATGHVLLVYTDTGPAEATGLRSQRRRDPRLLDPRNRSSEARACPSHFLQTYTELRKGWVTTARWTGPTPSLKTP
jgi:hypothetical protein